MSEFDPQPDPAAPLSPRSDAIVDAWFVEQFHGLAIPSDLFNRFTDAKEALKARLRAKEP